VQVGSLFVVPYTGGTIGRLPECEVYLDDVNVSKKHAKFGYNQEEKSFTIIDLGSRNGTFIHLVSYRYELIPFCNYKATNFIVGASFRIQRNQ
jgi:pSer/pThr/pTyr-binding forkhead associated (FHA) protein